MGILGMSREARGVVMLNELDDIAARIDAANDKALSRFFGKIAHSIAPVRTKYETSSDSDRKAILRLLKKSAGEMWEQGDWPSALGLGVVSLNVESQFVPGPDASMVKANTALLILKAASGQVADSR
jgi:hypothetical protein